MARVFVIVNPAAGGGRAAKQWPHVATRLRNVLGNFETAMTKGPDKARGMARQAAGQYDLIVSCGGDGTTHEVVNGLYEAPIKRRLGILSLGSGCDFIQGLKIPRDINKQIEILRSQHSTWVDLIRITFVDHRKKRQNRVFINTTDAGMGADVMIRGKKWKRYHRKIAYFLATLESFAHWKNKPVTVKVDGRTVWDGSCLLVAVANGPSFGSGMPIAPQAILTDGFLDITIISRLNPMEILLALPLLYAKRLHHLPHVLSARGTEATLSSPETVSLNIDGEPIGFLPATFSIIPRALEVKTL